MSTTEAPEATGQTACADRSDRSSPVRCTEPTGQTGHPDRSDRSNIEWLQQRLDQYRARTNDMCEAIEDSDDLDKLGQGFASADPLEKVDIGDGTIPRPTFVNKNLSAEYKADLVNLLKEYVDCFAWEYHEMPGLSRDLVEYRLPIKAGFRPYKQPVRHFNPIIYDRIKLKLTVCLMLDLFGLVVMLIGSLILCLLRKRIRGKLECALILEILIKLLPRMNTLWL